MVPLSDPELRKFLRTSDENILLVLCESAYKFVRGHVKVQIINLMQNENVFKTVLRKNVSVEKKKVITDFGLVCLIIHFCHKYLSQP